MGFFLLTMGIVFELTASMPDAAHRFLGVIFVLAFSALTAADLVKTKRLSKTHVLEAYVLSFFLLYRILIKELYPFYFVQTKISGGLSVIVGTMIGKPISMGVTYSGIDVFILFLTALIAAAVIYKRMTPKKCLLYVALFLFIWAFYVGFWTTLAESSLTLRLNLLEPITGPLDYRALLFAMLFAAYMPVYKKMSEGEEDGRLSKKEKLLPAALLTLCAAATLFFFIPSRPPWESSGKRIVFWDTGIDFSVPEHGRYGLDYAGMFGILPHYLSYRGYSCETVTQISGELLDESDVLVVFNPMYSPGEDELKNIRRFVEEGGSILAVGDHTGNEQIRLPLNAILEPSGISLSFDSAIPFKSLWASDYSQSRSPIFTGVGDGQIQLVVGASLEAGPGARALVIGKEGFSDLGDIENIADGYLGDMHFSRGERIGDLILAAEASYGRGKFMAFGDTTAFQNAIIPYSYKFIDNIFAYLSDNGKDRGAVRGGDGFFAASCLIDVSHLEVFAKDKSSNAVDGFMLCSMRAGFLPRLVDDGAELRGLLEEPGDARLLVLVEPALTFSEDDKQALRRFMEEGATVLLCAGYDSPKASRELAEYFGFSFDAIPIGRIAPDKDPEMAFWNACPVLYNGISLAQSGEGAESLMDIWGYTVMARKSVGGGKLYVFGDPDFLKNKNLESVDTYREGNVMFVDALLTGILENRG